MKNLETITLPSPAWEIGMMAFVYSKSGHDFIVKGNELGVVAKVKEMSRFDPCLCHYTFWNHGKSRGVWEFVGVPDVIIRRVQFPRQAPRKAKYFVKKLDSTQSLSFRRMPNRWLPVFDEFLSEPVSQKKNLFGEIVPRADW